MEADLRLSSPPLSATSATSAAPPFSHNAAGDAVAKGCLGPIRGIGPPFYCPRIAVLNVIDSLIKIVTVAGPAPPVSPPLNVAILLPRSRLDHLAEAARPRDLEARHGERRLTAAHISLEQRSPSPREEDYEQNNMGSPAGVHQGCEPKMSLAEALV